MKATAGEIAQLVGGQVAGNAAAAVTGVAPLDDAGSSDLSFVAEEKYYKNLPQSKAGIVLIHKNKTAEGKTAILVDHPQLAFLKILNVIAKEKETVVSGIHPTAIVAKDAILGANVAIGPYAVVESGAKIGDGSSIGALSFIGHKTALGKNCKIYPRVTLREEITLGDRVTVHSGTVIGTDGFGYAFINKEHVKIPQIGTVEIDDDVEIGSNAAIDRATMGKTVIGAGSKIDNLVQIAHNVKLGKGCIIVSQAGIAGSCNLGNFVTLAGQVGIGDHVNIGDGVIAAAQSGVPNDVPAGSIIFGSPARPIREERKIQVIIGKLPEIYDDIKKLKKQSGLALEKSS